MQLAPDAVDSSYPKARDRATCAQFDGEAGGERSGPVDRATPDPRPRCDVKWPRRIIMWYRQASRAKYSEVREVEWTTALDDVYVVRIHDIHA
jgi:hypothetical protein